jgi:cytochrome c553
VNANSKIWAVAVALAVGGMAAVATYAAPAVEPSPAASMEQSAFFEKSIRPVLLTECGTCHGPALQQGGLRVDSRAALLKGGKRGPSLVPGKPEASLFLAAINHQQGMKMPPAKRIEKRVVADLTRWVKEGAVWPSYTVAGPKSKVPGPRVDKVGGNAAGGSSEAVHWAFRPVTRPQVPSVKNKAWVKTPIDAFILARLEEKGLSPAKPADRRTLLRRVTFDLTGLPPTPDEVEAFVSDRSPGAWTNVVDRLLASPAYGERWGRHWLDVARYADSNGQDENICHGNAWRYRDWVVNSLNADKPIDRFLQEQLAGDLMPSSNHAERAGQLVATGYLVLGPKVLAEADKSKLLMDLIDEQIDTVGRSMMGLTLGCARCHDHKFDPLSAEDYYALAGIFKSTKTMESLATIAKWWENSIADDNDLARKKEHDEKVAAQKSVIDGLIARGKGELTAAGKMVPTDAKQAEALFSDPTKAELAKARETLAQLEKSAPEMPMAMGVTEGESADVPVHLRGSTQNLGKVVPRRFPIVLAGSSQSPMAPKHSGRMELAQWITRPDHPLTGRVFVNRVWRWHFGRGIVASTDNFGRLGQLPTHPELLDWLASEFTATPSDGLGWSLKKLHRLILNSSTYQMASVWEAPRSKVQSQKVSGAIAQGVGGVPEPGARAPRSPHSGSKVRGKSSDLDLGLGTLDSIHNPQSIDAGNSLCWRFEPRRLEAEEIRDTLLAVSGRLDRKLGGSLLQTKNREFFFDHTSKDTTNYDSTRRSIYLPVVRNHLYDVFQLFDFGDGAIIEGNRATTTVAPQALFMLNSDLVIQSAESLAKDLVGQTSLDDTSRARLLVQRAYGRPATPREVERVLGVVQRITASLSGGPDAAQRQQKAWSGACQSVMAANEFIYVR